MENAESLLQPFLQTAVKESEMNGLSKKNVRLTAKGTTQDVHFELEMPK